MAVGDMETPQGEATFSGRDIDKVVTETSQADLEKQQGVTDRPKYVGAINALFGVLGEVEPETGETTQKYKKRVSERFDAVADQLSNAYPVSSGITEFDRPNSESPVDIDQHVSDVVSRVGKSAETSIEAQIQRVIKEMREGLDEGLTHEVMNAHDVRDVLHSKLSDRAVRLAASFKTGEHEK